MAATVPGQGEDAETEWEEDECGSLDTAEDDELEEDKSAW